MLAQVSESSPKPLPTHILLLYDFFHLSWNQPKGMWNKNIMNNSSLSKEERLDYYCPGNNATIRERVGEIFLALAIFLYDNFSLKQL